MRRSSVQIRSPAPYLSRLSEEEDRLDFETSPWGTLGAPFGQFASGTPATRRQLDAGGTALQDPAAIPAAFALSWTQFIDEWCLGTPPGVDEQACGRALSALIKHWPERAQALFAEPARGLGVIVGAIDLGLVLADAAELPGFDTVLSRVRAGDRSAVSELTVAAVLARTGLAPGFGVQTGTKVPDIAIATGRTTTFIEVIAPNRAEIVKEFTQRIGEIASSIAAANPSMNIEFLLDGDLDEVDLVALTKQVAEAPCSDEIQDIIRPSG
jgi:hypothetical protein